MMRWVRVSSCDGSSRHRRLAAVPDGSSVGPLDLGVERALEALGVIAAKLKVFVL